MISDKYKQADGTFVGDDGCECDDLETFLQCGFLEFCGCGAVQDNLLYILGGLELIDRRIKGPDTYEAAVEYCKERRVCEQRHFGSPEAAHFFYYWVHSMDLSEHGTGLPGSLSEKGRELLAMLREYKEIQGVQK